MAYLALNRIAIGECDLKTVQHVITHGLLVLLWERLKAWVVAEGRSSPLRPVEVLEEPDVGQGLPDVHNEVLAIEVQIRRRKADKTGVEGELRHCLPARVRSISMVSNPPRVSV